MCRGGRQDQSRRHPPPPPGEAGDLREIRDRTAAYLRERLIPFWATRVVEPRHGGFRTHYDRHGRPEPGAAKTLLCQGRCLFAIAHAGRQGFPWPGGREAAAAGLDFLDRRFRDREEDGYFWILDEAGAVRDDRKVVYGHAFLIYGLAEHARWSGEEWAAAEAARLFDLIQARAADPARGGFLEILDRTFRPIAARPDGRLHKSLDVHMHLMEAFAALAALTGEERHRQAALDTADLIFSRMVDPVTGTGLAMFSPAWEPLPNVELGAVWGSDRFPAAGKPAAITSYGHNVELAWLLLHTLEELGLDPADARGRAEPLFAHTLRHGLDREWGGLFTEGHRETGPTETNKEFWQQAEALVGFLAAYRLTGDPAYLAAFRNIHRFVFDRMIHWDQGEWFPLLDRQGRVIWDYMGHAWKICYHTVRSMVQVVLRLDTLLQGQAT